jgi:LCP family protein required for cell wall assembly
MKLFKRVKENFPKDWPTRILLLVLILLAVVGTVFASRYVRKAVAQTTAFSLPGDPVVETTDESITGDPENIEATQSQSNRRPRADLPDPDPWDGSSRVNVLVMGLDLRDTEVGDTAPRSDTMILLSMDPLNNTAAAIAIPRDLWVSIPGFLDYQKINTAFRFGELYNIPGGGPALASQTVEQLLGVPIDFYVQIDFQAFVDFIDDIHGLRFTFTEPYKLDPRGEGNTEFIEPGEYVLDGELALAYARDRKSAGDDFDRSSRQMEVILKIRDRILELNQLPVLVANAPSIYSDLSTGIRTNMGLDQMIQFAWKAREIPVENIQMVVIGPEYITIEKSPDGLDILRPIHDKIRLLRDEVLGTGGVIGPVTTGNLADLVAQENARISVLNGTYQADLGTRTAAWLRDQGFNVVEEGNAQYTIYSSVTLQGSVPYSLKFLVDSFSLTAGRITNTYTPNASTDIILILGDDWAANNPMP